MANKEDILKKYRANVRERYDMPDLSDIKAITYPDPLSQFINMTKSVGGNAFKSTVSGGSGDARSRSCSWDDEE